MRKTQGYRKAARRTGAASGLDWKVVQKGILTEDGDPAPGFRANVRDSYGKVLGIVSDRYRVAQNGEAFAFTDRLLGEGVRYETAGSLNGEGNENIRSGKRTMRFDAVFYIIPEYECPECVLKIDGLLREKEGCFLEESS